MDWLKTAENGFASIDVDADVKARAIAHLERWLERDEFADAVPQLEHLIATGNFNALFDAFFREIPFGTGGRRGPVGFGTNRINAHTIGTSIQGHCEFLRRHRPGRGIHVVVAFDVRVFNDLRGVYDPRRANPLLGMSSRDFARIAAGVYAANGIRVWFPHPDSATWVSTPELSFATRHVGADAGLNISASHNHPDDNGAKIYNGNGAQEVPPLDQEMAEIVERIDSAASMRWNDAVDGGLVRWLPREIHEGYIRANLAAALGTTRSAKVVFSPLHGVGRDSCGAVLEEAGFDVDFVASQSTPDGAFPNVPFRSPNPEVAESLDAATRRAAEIGADLVLVSDPDADRIGMAVPDSERGWTRLSGDQIGLLLASWLFESRSRRGRRDGFAATTVVTTSLFRRVAESYGVETISDLGIGFKYIADVLGRIESMGEYRGFRGAIDDFVLGVEESHGYLVTHSVRDKDAAGAALLLAELISSLKDRGETALGHLDRIYLRYGYVANLLRSTVMTGAMGFIAIREVQRSLRDDPPRRIGDLEVLRFIDRHDETGPLGPFSSETDKAARDLLTFELEAGARVVLRPSGTESKNKIYVEVIGEPLGDRASTADLAAEKRAIDRRAATVAKDFLELALARIETAMPRWALDVSDLAPLEAKIRFGELFVEFVHRIECGAVDLSDWLEAALAPLGSDARLLVRGAVESYLRDENPPARVSSVLCELFELRPRSG